MPLSGNLKWKFWVAQMKPKHINTGKRAIGVILKRALA